MFMDKFQKTETIMSQLSQLLKFMGLKEKLSKRASLKAIVTKIKLGILTQHVRQKSL